MAAGDADVRCRMHSLQEDSTTPIPSTVASVRSAPGPRYNGPLDARLVREAALHLRSRPLILDVKKMAPDPEGKMRKLGEDVRAEEGRALARLGDGGWDPLIAEGRRGGHFEDELGPRLRLRRSGPGARRCAGSPPCPPGAAARSSRTSRSGSPRRWACPSTSCSSASATTRRSAR